jgi:hypothetical protein
MEEQNKTYKSSRSLRQARNQSFKTARQDGATSATCHPSCLAALCCGGEIVDPQSTCIELSRYRTQIFPLWAGTFIIPAALHSARGMAISHHSMPAELYRIDFVSFWNQITHHPPEVTPHASSAFPGQGISKPNLILLISTGAICSRETQYVCVTINGLYCTYMVVHQLR